MSTLGDAAAADKFPAMTPTHAPDDYSRNNFDILRFAAAVMVVFAHAYVLSGHPLDEPLSRQTALEDFGSLGVSIFFVISGFLVTSSFLRKPNLPAFLVNRALRLLPALGVVSVLSAFLIGPLVTTLPIGAYLLRPATWLYPVRNLLIFPVDYALPGVFAANPYPNAVNGSLWTLRLEVSFYLVIAFLGWRRALGTGALAGVFALAALFYEALHLGVIHAPVQAMLLCRTAVLFFAGGLAYAAAGEGFWRSRWGWALGAAALVVLGAAAPFRPVGMAILPLVLAPVVLSLAFAPIPLIHRWGRFGDLSYGVYLWAFPAGQTLMKVEGAAVTPMSLAFQSLALTLPLAAASWWLIERRALGAKGAIHARLARFDEPPIGPDDWGDGERRDRGLRELSPLPPADR
jgi:peptidoglycan/LPS O-acetylase OafA/YrhL